MFFNFIRSLFKKENEEIHVTEIKNFIKVTEEIVQPTVEPKKIDHPGAYYHTQQRLHERFGYYLSYENYQKWCDLIITGSPKARFVRHSGGNPSGTKSKIYILDMFQKKIPVVFRAEQGLIVTVLPFNPEMEREATLKRPKPKGRASKQVGRGDLNKYKKV